MAAWLVTYWVEDIDKPEMSFEASAVVSAEDFSQLEGAIRAREMRSDERVDYVLSAERIADDVIDYTGALVPTKAEA